MTSASNEIMIENVSAKDIAGAIVQSAEERQSMIDYFHKAGLAEINGCPVEKFVVVGSPSSNLKASLAKLPLLQE